MKSIELVYHRSSSLGQFKYCQMSWFINYVLGHNAPSNAKADLGSTVHAVLETLAIAKKYIQDFSPAPNESFTIEQEPVGKFTITTNELYEESFPSKTLERCLRFYIENNTHNVFDYDRDFKDCRKMLYDTLEFNSGEFDPRKLNILEPERGFNIPIEYDWAKYITPDGKEDYIRIKGTMDLVTIIDKSTIRICDYKTGKRINWATGKTKEYNDLQDDMQLLLYNYAIKKVYPMYKNIETVIYFCKDGGPFYLSFDEYDSELFLSKLKTAHEEMTTCKRPKPVSEKRNDFRCTKLCHFYKNKWPNSELSMCEYIDNYNWKHGIKSTIENCTKEGFTLSHYVDPGSVNR